MALTIKQALQQGVAAHSEGKLEDAERLYRAILQSQPLHPDANHNLGVLAVSVNKGDAALSLFKTALEANPKIEQFWLSYIEALITEKQVDNAKHVFEQAKTQGVSEEKLNVLEERLALIEQVSKSTLSEQKKSKILSGKSEKLAGKKKSKKTKKQNLKAKSSSEKLLNSLLEHYQNGRFRDAEKLSVEITKNFPAQQLAWKVLGAILGAKGRNSEALDANQTAVALSPQDAEAHSNLGITLKELGRLDEALASYTQAIALKPDYAEAHSNLGTTLHKLGRLVEAEASYRRAIALQPDYAEAHSNLGVTLHELGRPVEAEASYTQAIALKPDYAEAQYNLGITLKELGRLDEALASYTRATALKPRYAGAILNLSIAQSYMNDLEAEIISLQNILQIDSDCYGLRARVNLAICFFLRGDFRESEKHILAATAIQNETSSESKNERVYWRYLSNILKWHKNECLGAKKEKNVENLYVIGDSHSLSSHHLFIRNSGINFFCSAKLIKGCKQWHLGNAYRNPYKYQFETIFSALPKHSYILVAVGEIDCRLDTGIIAHKKKFPEKQIKEIIAKTIEDYLNYIVNHNSDYHHNVTIQGVPCPNLEVGNLKDKDIRCLGEVIEIFNYQLKMQSKEMGFGFLDTHDLTNKGDGMSNGSWHIDAYHLSPEGIQEVWRRFDSERSFKQF